MIRKREPHWESAAERAQVAAELMEEAESLTARGIATPAEVKRSQLPPPLEVDFSRPPAGSADARIGDPGVELSATPVAPMPPQLPPRELARAAVSRGDHEGALAVLDAALAATPDDTVLLLERSVVHAASGRYGAARHDLEHVLRAEPGHIEALMSLGTLVSRRGLWVEAVPHFRRAVELQPGYAAAWYQLGESLNHLDSLSEARAAYERAIELEPRHARALYGLGIVFDRLKRPDDATHMYRRSREAAGR